MTSDEELRKKAKKRAEEKMSFYIHFTIYILVNILLYLIWWIQHGPNTHPWPVWATFGWGIGIVFHFIGVFLSSNFEEKLADKEYQKLKGKNK